jgi:hypothetical protein
MKIFFSIFLSFLLGLAIFIFFLPDIASTKFATSLVSHYIEKKSGFQVKSVSFSWKGPLIIEGISFEKRSKKFFADKLVYQNKKLLLQNSKVWVQGHHLKSDEISVDLGDDFQIPLFFSWDLLEIPHMTIKLGKIMWQNFGTVKELLSILQLKIRIDADIPLWFQDAPASLKNGILSISRTEFLVDNSYEFAVWDKIDFLAKEFNLIFGIPKSTIQNVLDIRNLPKNYTIPMRFDGPFNNPTLHKSSAIKTIGALLLLKQLPLSPIPQVKESPKARRPFPWDKR